jgi:hypothetical protein
MSALPCWMQWVVAIAQILIALFATVFAFYFGLQQWKLTKRKLHIDLFDRRYKFYKTLADFKEHIEKNGMPDKAEVIKLTKHLENAQYFFEDDIVKYISDVTNLARTAWDSVGDQLPNSSDHLQNYLDKLDHVFSRYLVLWKQ